MANRRGTGRGRRLPPFVQVRHDPRDRELPTDQRRVTAYRAWAMIGRRRCYGPWRDEPLAAHRDAIELRAGDAATPFVTKTLREAAEAMHCELVGLRRDGTVQFYKAQAKAVFRIIDGDLPLARLTPGVLQQLVALAQRGGFAARTIQHYRRWLNRLVRWCSMPQRQWFRGENPVPLASWPEPRQASPDVLGEAELAARLEHLRTVAPDDFDLVIFLAYSGLRRAELARLHAADFDLGRSVFLVRGKTDDVPAPITAPILAVAQRLVERARGGFIVAGESEKRRVQAIDRVFRRWAKRFGDRRFHPHALRHSLATNLIRAGVPAGTVQAMLRHSSYATTQRYVHLVAADLHAASGRLRYVEGGQAAADHG
ncbi:MAG: site-specific integrase [Planctomycetes bacterium]|nr:site-specific integrase [Planctomycetota bacterium]